MSETKILSGYSQNIFKQFKYSGTFNIDFSFSHDQGMTSGIKYINNVIYEYVK